MEVLLLGLVLVVVEVMEVMELVEVVKVMEVVEVEETLQRVVVVAVVVVLVAVAAAGAGEAQQGDHEGGIWLEVRETAGWQWEGSQSGDFPENPQSLQVRTNYSRFEEIARS